MTTTQHKHADLINALAEGAEIQYRFKGGLASEMWINISPQSLLDAYEFRVKPKEPDWWENIPKHGALFKYVTDEGLANGSIRVFYSRPIGAKNWVPLTNEEIEVFKR